MTLFAQNAAPGNSVREKGLPAGGQQLIFLAHGFVFDEVREVGDELRADRADFTAFIQAQGWTVLLFKVPAFTIFRMTCFLDCEMFLQSTLAEAKEKGTVLLGTPGRVAGIALKLGHVFGDAVLKDGEVRFVAVGAGFGCPLALGKACHGVAVSAVKPGLHVNIGEHGEIGLAVLILIALITSMIFTRGLSEIISADEIPSMAGVTLSTGGSYWLVSITTMAACATIDMATHAVFVEEIRIDRAEGLVDKCSFCNPGGHGLVEDLHGVLMAGLTGLGYRGGCWCGAIVTVAGRAGKSCMACTACHLGCRCVCIFTGRCRLCAQNNQEAEAD